MPLEQLPLISAENLAECVRPPVPREDCYVLFSYSRQWGWKLHRGCHETEEDAANQVRFLSPLWTSYQVVRIPGTKKGA